MLTIAPRCRQSDCELTKNWIARRQRVVRDFCNCASAAVDQSSPGHRRNAHNPNERKLDRPDRCRHSLRVAVATGFATLNRSNDLTNHASHSLLGHFESQSRGTSTYVASSSTTDAQPSSLSVRTRSERKISIARATPAPPAAPSP